MLAAGGDSIVEVRNRALLGVACDTLLRRSELVALRIEDLVMERNGSATALVRRTNTDQESYGAEAWVAPDTVRLLEKWFERSGVTQGLVFRSLPHRTLGGPLGGREVPRIFKEMAAKAGLPRRAIKRVSGHSTRVGATQDMVADGIPLAKFMQSGRWKTVVSVMHYAGRMLAQRSGAAQLARLQGRFWGTICSGKGGSFETPGQRLSAIEAATGRWRRRNRERTGNSSNTNALRHDDASGKRSVNDPAVDARRGIQGIGQAIATIAAGSHPLQTPLRPSEGPQHLGGGPSSATASHHSRSC